MPDAPLTPSARTARAGGARLLGAAVALAALTLGAAACSSTPSSEPSSSTTTSAAPTGVTETASKYATIAALHQAIVDGGFECTLEYPGLRDDATANEVSICTIQDETAYLTIWGDPDKLTEFAASTDGATGTVALGEDWSVAVTTPGLASKLATALGGTAPSGSASGSTGTTAAS